MYTVPTQRIEDQIEKKRIENSNRKSRQALPLCSRLYRSAGEDSCRVPRSIPT